MFRGSAEELAAAVARRFWARDFGLMAEIYAVPFPVYVEGEIVTYHDRRELIAGLSALRDRLDSEGMTTMCAQLVAESPCRNGSFTACIDFRYSPGPEGPVRSNGVVYYCRRPFGPRAAEVQVAMAEYRRMGFDLGPLASHAARTLRRAEAAPARGPFAPRSRTH